MAEQGRSYYISRINFQLSNLATAVKLNSTDNRNDLAVDTEDTVGGLLNMVFGLELINANKEKHNYPAVDLIDTKKRIAFQISVQNDLKKVDDMLEKFEKHNLKLDFSRLVMFVISEKEPTKTMRERESVRFCGATDIWNLNTVRDEIKGMSVEKLKQIAEYLDQEVGELGQDAADTSETLQEEEPGKKHEGKREPNEKKKSHRQFIYYGIFLLVMVFALVIVKNGGVPFINRNIPKEIAKYQMIINGDVIRLPVTLDEMASYGWVCTDDTDLDDLWIMPYDAGGSYGTYEEGFSSADKIVLTNGYGEITIGLMNPCDYPLKAEGCAVNKIEISSDTFHYDGKSLNTLELPLGLELGKSQWYRLFAAGGYLNTEQSNNMLYQYADKWSRQYIFWFDKASEKLSSVTMEIHDPYELGRVADSDKYIHTVKYDTEAIYKWMDVQISVDIDNRTIPIFATVSEYLDNGFLIEGKLDELQNMETSIIKLQDDTGFGMYMLVYNPIFCHLFEDSCMLLSVSTADFIDYNGDFSVKAELGKESINISKGMSKDALITQLDNLGEKVINVGDHGHSIEVFLYTNTMITCKLSAEDQTIENVEISLECSLTSYLNDYNENWFANG